MRILGTLVLAAAVIGFSAAPARAQLNVQFGKLPAGTGKPVKHGPRIHLDFGQGLPLPFVTPAPPTPPPALQPAIPPTSIVVTGGAPIIVTEEVPAMDCGMVREAPANIDPRFVQRPAPDAHYTMRVRPVAPCPASSRGDR